MNALLKSLAPNHSVQLLSLNMLHVLNDGYQSSFLLLLPFIAKDLHLSLTEVGLLGTVVSALGIVLALPAGYIANKFGGMKALILALLVYGIGYLATGFAANYLTLLITFLIVGAGWGIFHPIAFALIAKWSTKETRGKQMGNFTALGDVGRIGIAALITFIVAAIGWQYAAIGYAAVAIIIALLFYVLFVSKKEQVTTKEKSIPNIKLWDILKHKQFIFAAAAAAFDSFASSSLFVFLPFLLLAKGVSPAFLGSFTAAFFIGNFVGKTVLGRFVDKFGNTKVLMVAELFMAIFILLLANTTSFFFIIGCSIVLGVFTKGTIPVLQTMVSEAGEHHGNFEKVFGANELISYSAKTAAPVLLGIISDKLGIITAFNVMAVVALMAIIPAFAFQRTKAA